MDLSPPVAVAALYRFARIAEPAALRARLAALADALALKGTLIVAPEGVNGTVAGTPEAIGRLLARVEAEPALAGAEIKLSRAAAMPFYRMKVRLKREIVTLGVAGLDPAARTGRHVAPGEWNALVDDPATVLIDTRNAYETALGSFRGALDPGTDSFRAFPAWAEANRARLAGRPIAMFCTGGIRCEKASALLLAQGHERVFQLSGGILAYLEQVPADGSRWRGECFVFDERVSLVHGLERGRAALCRACRRPLTPAERASPLYRAGVACPHCHAERSAADRARYAERQRQVERAAARGGTPHIGR
ncbi:rhodanese-related sulfurtransferase [Aquibium sp. A9E412]|uniref:oxygen-dependent tRNA uridine(34) hydroxylase TrhO n=1 Tax=Aquibium sp. A9E412 TaxID=2976767 RepID=UPI0025B0C547|nr:rhodanese-related sulfurtransferase [Aquibium sp. A9E412]MDN2567285.1 rhodanese-related sulfurtransferase [Aquibium sp. A9E412]